MKKLISTLVTSLALACLLGLPAASYAQKVAYVDVVQLFNEYAKTKGLDKTFEEKFAAKTNELEKLVIDLKALEKEINTNQLLMTESKLTESKTKLQKMAGEYREKGMALEKEVQSARNKEMIEFRKIAFDVTKKYATDKKYDLVVNEGVMFASDNINITDDILKLVNKAAK